jgi:hypothetical protein
MAELQAKVDDAKGGSKDDCCATSNWYAGFDFAILQPHLGAVQLTLGPAGADLTPDFDFALAPRVWVAYDNPEGLGVRASYWQFDNGTDFTSPLLGDTSMGLEAQTLDAEVTQRASIGCLELQVAGGLRYGTLRNDLVAEDAILFLPTLELAAEFEGLGPTFAVDLRRPFGSRDLALVGGVRAAWLYGNTDLVVPGLVEAKAVDHMMQVWAANLGVEWSRSLALGGQVVVRALWEAQAWEWSPMLTLIHEDIGFSGPTVSLGYVW